MTRKGSTIQVHRGQRRRTIAAQSMLVFYALSYGAVERARRTVTRSTPPVSPARLPTVKQSRGLNGHFIFTSASFTIYARIYAAGNKSCRTAKLPPLASRQRASESQLGRPERLSNARRCLLLAAIINSRSSRESARTGAALGSISA